jgi:hypothetical protein
MNLEPLYRQRRISANPTQYRIRDELDYVQVTSIYARYPERIVRLVAPDGETIMGYVPHEIVGAPVELHFKRRFFDPEAKD